jgi:SAM-dependent methyltransferase
VGSGRSLFPDNPWLARQLADRASLLVGLDPDAAIDENPYLHERVRGTLEDFHPAGDFDLVTLRMVAEHITEPEAALESLKRLVRPGGKVVIYTVNQSSPLTLAAWLVPFGLHRRVKRVLWRTEERDTFPVAYRMNSRRRLGELFELNGFRQCYFAYLDDCRKFHRFRWLQRLELACWRLLKDVGLPYPETCLLAVFERE